jgi:hypothetical protein
MGSLGKEGDAVHGRRTIDGRRWARRVTPLERAAGLERVGRLEEVAAHYEDAARGAPDARARAALGQPVWTVLPLVPDRRWLLGRADTPWYPTMRLYRPRRLGDWREVLGRVARDLAARRG